MKNRWYFLFFTFFFLLGTSFVNAVSLMTDGGEELLIVASKSGDVIYSFDIPKKYVTKEGNWVLPVNVEVNQNNKQPFYIVETSKSQITIPEITGDYIITIKIADYEVHYIVQD